MAGEATAREAPAVADAIPRHAPLHGALQGRQRLGRQGIDAFGDGTLRLRQAADVGKDGLVADRGLRGACPASHGDRQRRRRGLSFVTRRHRCIPARLSLPSMNDDGPAAAPLTNSRHSGTRASGVDQLGRRRHHRPTRRGMTEQTMADDTRIDRWLCAVRLVKTRPMATQLCEGGHVRVNGNPAKPATEVRAGDVVHALIAERERMVEVVRPIETRVGAPATATCYVDNSPPPVIREITPASWPSVARAGRARPSPRARADAAGRRRLTACRPGDGCHAAAYGFG